MMKMMLPLFLVITSATIHVTVSEINGHTREVELEDGFTLSKLRTQLRFPTSHDFVLLIDNHIADEDHVLQDGDIIMFPMTPDFFFATFNLRSPVKIYLKDTFELEWILICILSTQLSLRKGRLFCLTGLL